MNGLTIINEENKEVKAYALYYTVNERFYVIYTEKEKDENGYIVLHIAKVLKEVNNTPEGIVPTGKYIGLEISDQSEWDNAKANIGEIVSNKQNNTPTSVSYLSVDEINGISIKSSKTFKLREDVVDSIIVEENADDGVAIMPTALPEIPAEDVAVEAPVAEELPNLEDIPTAPVAEMPAIEEAPVVEDVAVEAPVTEELTSLDDIPAAPVAPTVDIDTPALAPNPFEMQPEVEIPEPAITEEAPAQVNPYEVMQQQRAEEMINALANDNMQDIVASPVLSVTDLESKVEETPAEVPVEAPVTEELTSLDDIPAAPVADVPVEETPVEEAPAAPAVEEEAIVEEVKEEPVSTESFVDSIVADVSDILDKKEEQTPEEKEDYERLYNDALEKTVELEKELAELHNKLNNIKNIIE